MRYITAREAILFGQSCASELLALECGKALYKVARIKEIYPPEERTKQMASLIASYKPLFNISGEEMPKHMTSPELYMKRLEELGM